MFKNGYNAQDIAGGEEVLLEIKAEKEEDGSYYARISEACTGSSSGTIADLVNKCLQWADVYEIEFTLDTELSDIRAFFKENSSDNFQVTVYTDF